VHEADMTPGSAVHQGIAHPHARGGTGIVPNFPEPPFDDIVHLARQVCGSAIALVAVAERDGLAIRACAGLDAGDAADAHTFCAHALQAPVPIEIAELRGDARFAGHRLVAGAPGLRFWAGVALEGREGRIGSLNVLDRQPRMLDATQRDGLAALARLTVTFLEHRRGAAGGLDTSGAWPAAEPTPPAWTTLPPKERASSRAADSRYAVAIIELDGGSVPAPAHERVMQQVQDIVASVLGHEDVLSRDGPGELLAVFAHAERARAALERIGAASTALPSRPRIAIGAATGRHDRDAMEDVFLEAESALHRARAGDGPRLVLAPRPALDS
jgi:hypothetical protein